MDGDVVVVAHGSRTRPHERGETGSRAIPLEHLFMMTKGCDKIASPAERSKKIRKMNFDPTLRALVGASVSDALQERVMPAL
jgi:hypothetical protein